MRTFHQLTKKDRIMIEKGLEEGKTKSEIAREIQVHRSTITRETKRNCNSKGSYKAVGAQAFARDRRPHIFCYGRKIEGILEEIVCELLEKRFSPEQISDRLKFEGSKWKVSHETIYKWVYKVAPGYKKYLRWKSRCRQKRSRRPRRGLGRMPRKMIDLRTNAANERLEVGHWERDLLEGRRGGAALLVLEDRRTRKTKIRKVRTKFADEVGRATEAALRGENIKTLTNDNGNEFGKYEDLEAKLKIPIYFCHPYTSWERGSVENTNGLLRQYIPKKTDISKISDEQIKWLENEINNRPRKVLEGLTPDEVHLGVRTKLIKSDEQYNKQKYEREAAEFKEAMLKVTGVFYE